MRPIAAPAARDLQHPLADLLGEGDDRLDVLVRLERQPDHVVELQVLDAVLEDPGGLVEDLGVRELLVEDLPHAVGAALGGEGQALDAGVGELEDELRGQVVEPQRGDRDLVVHGREVVHDPVDLGVVADRGRDEADLAGDRPHLARPRHELAPREAADRQVVVAGPAEAAHAGAAARDLHHVLHGHLGVRGEDDRLREAHGARPAALARDAAGAVVGGDRAVRVVADLVAGGDVEAVLRLEGLEALPRVRGPEERLHHPRHDRLALAHRDEVGEGSERLRVQEHRGPAEDHDGVARPAVLRPQRDAGEAQHLQHVQVVVLERDREGDRVELPQRRPGLEARERAAGPLELGLVLVVGQEGALADDVRGPVEQPVDGLEPQVRHPDEVEVGPDERHPERARAGHVLEEHLRLAKGPVPFLEPSGQAPIVYGLVQINDRSGAPGHRPQAPGRPPIRRRRNPGSRGGEPPATCRGCGDCRAVSVRNPGEFEGVEPPHLKGSWRRAVSALMPRMSRDAGCPVFVVAGSVIQRPGTGQPPRPRPRAASFETGGCHPPVPPRVAVASRVRVSVSVLLASPPAAPC